MLCAVQDFPVVCVEGVHSVCFSPILFLFMHTKAKVDPCSDELNSLCVNIYKETSIALYLFIFFPFYITAASWICYFICFDYVCLILWMFYEPVFRTAKSLFLKKRKKYTTDLIHYSVMCSSCCFPFCLVYVTLWYLTPHTVPAHMCSHHTLSNKAKGGQIRASV